MSRILKSIINSAINDDRKLKILYYPSGNNEFDENILSLNFDFYLPLEDKNLLKKTNVFFQSDIINQHISSIFDFIILGNPAAHFNIAKNIASQLHINLLSIFLEEPKRIKKELLFVNAEKIQQNSICTVFSSDIASKWFINKFELLNNITDICEVIKKWKTVYIKN